MFCVLFLIFVSIIICCPVICLFCDQRLIDTAFSYQEHTILFRKNQIWFFNIKTNSVSSEAFALNDVIKDNRIKSVDSIFASTNSDHNFTIVYVFSNNKYYLLKPIESGINSSSKAPIVFEPLSAQTDVKYVSKKWSVLGDRSLDEVLFNKTIWFPKDIDEAVVLKVNELYLFHSNSIRYTMITERWPEGREWEFPFVGVLKELNKIDAVFRITDEQNSDKLVIVEGLRYCRFQRVKTNISIYIEESCKWKDSKELFGCNDNQNKTTIISSTITQSTKISPIITQSTKATLLTSSETESEQKFGNKTGIILIVIVIALILSIGLLIIFSVVLIAYISRRKSNTNTTTDQPNMSTTTLQDSGLSSVQTLDSNTGKRIDEN